MTTMTSKFQSGFATGTIVQLTRKGKTLYATLRAGVPNGEHWRISCDRDGEQYVYSEGWPFVQEHAAGCECNGPDESCPLCSEL